MGAVVHTMGSTANHQVYFFGEIHTKRIILSER